jgi:hypothetical protein
VREAYEMATRSPSVRSRRLPAKRR